MTSLQIKNLVLIVGGSSSVGEAVINKFENAGCSVLTTYNKNKPVMKNSESHCMKLDLSDEDSIKALADHLSVEDEPLGTAIFLSGVLPGNNLAAYENSEIDSVMQVNFNGQAKLIKAIQPSFSENSHIIMMSSISAQRGSFDPIYAAAKGAIISFVKSQARAMNGRPRINAIMPGLINDSTMFHDMAPEIQKRHIQDTAAGALLELEDLGQIIFDLCQPHWISLNGACIPINGGSYV
ncbi:MAG: SDR family oxidoreductase [Rhodospirillales bacterium]|nr:SDR family oxidoreductase [Rhodospirillales bacterium]